MTQIPFEISVNEKMMNDHDGYYEREMLMKDFVQYEFQLLPIHWKIILFFGSIFK